MQISIFQPSIDIFQPQLVRIYHLIRMDNIVMEQNQSINLQALTGKKDLRIGFLFNHDGLHQIAHSAPIIPWLQRVAPDAQIEILTSSQAQTEAVSSHLDPSLKRPPFHALQQNKFWHIVEKLFGGIMPIRRISDLLSNRKLLAQYDALVVPETTSTVLRTHLKVDKVKLILMPHGAGDRQISFSPSNRHFDLVLLPGKKTQTQMLKADVIRPDANKIVGYPKFDSPTLGSRKKFFDNDKPIVLYNPHFDPKLSSWFEYGEKILDYFANQDRYNLIFAPHVMLFQRTFLGSVEHRTMKLRRTLPQRFKGLPHIHVDTGSMNSVDMSYTRAADIYMGDVSSQIYEFIERPRSAIFINSHEAEWENNDYYKFWNFGEVIEGLDGLDQALLRAETLNPHYAKVQNETFLDSFDFDPERSSSHRAALAIAEFMEADITHIEEEQLVRPAYGNVIPMDLHRKKA